jgi:septum formation protein
LILASASPQRRAILEQLGVSFRVCVSGAEELEEGEPREVAVENARRKALAVGAAEEPVLAVDTVVALDGRLYGKPGDREAAAATLRALAGRRHRVVSGVCLLAAGRQRTAAAVTEVSFRELAEGMLEWYLDTGEWRGRAGGYAIQGRGAALVHEISGDYLNVVGLPVAALVDLEPSLIFPAI